MRAAESIVLDVPPKSPEPQQKTTTVVMSKHTLLPNSTAQVSCFCYTLILTDGRSYIRISGNITLLTKYYHYAHFETISHYILPYTLLTHSMLTLIVSLDFSFQHLDGIILKFVLKIFHEE